MLCEKVPIGKRNRTYSFGLERFKIGTETIHGMIDMRKPAFVNPFLPHKRENKISWYFIEQSYVDMPISLIKTSKNLP